MITRLSAYRRHVARRLIGGGLLCAFVVALLPIPTLVRQDRVDADLSQPFPCQHHHCGCRTAEHCWKRCCCFSPAQRVAWAKAQRIEIPDDLLAAVDEEPSRADCSAKGCCAKRVARRTGDRALDPPSETTPAERSKPDVELGWLAQKCQGQVWSWSVLPWSILPDLSDDLITASPARPNHPQSDFAPQALRSPPVPPPRLPARAFSFA